MIDACDNYGRLIIDLPMSILDLSSDLASFPGRVFSPFERWVEKRRPGVHCMGVSAHARHNYPESAWVIVLRS